MKTVFAVVNRGSNYFCPVGWACGLAGGITSDRRVVTLEHITLSNKSQLKHSPAAQQTCFSRQKGDNLIRWFTVITTLGMTRHSRQEQSHAAGQSEIWWTVDLFGAKLKWLWDDKSRLSAYYICEVDNLSAFWFCLLYTMSKTTAVARNTVYSALHQLHFSWTVDGQ